jgi:hypothetical protein
VPGSLKSVNVVAVENVRLCNWPPALTLTRMFESAADGVCASAVRAPIVRLAIIAMIVVVVFVIDLLIPALAPACGNMVTRSS